MRIVATVALSLSLAACHRPAGPTGAAPKVHPKFDVHLHIHRGAALLALVLMDREGELGGVNLSGGSVGHGLEDSLEEAERIAHGRILVFANIDWDGFGTPGWTEREVAGLEKAKQLGARGLKIFKSLGLGIRDPQTKKLIAVDDPRVAPIFEAAGRLGLPVAIHTGDPKAFFRPPTPDNERYAELSQSPHWSFYGPGFPSWQEVFDGFERAVRAHPHTPFIGVHFGNDPEDPAYVAGMLDRYPNLYVDTAARVGEIGRMDPDKLRAIFLAHRTRILFGTDWGIREGGMMLGAPSGHPEDLADLDRFFALHARFFETGERQIDHPTPIQGAWKVDAIGLPEDVLGDLYLGNAERLLGWTPVAWPR